MRNLQDKFKNREINYSKLITYGFKKENNNYHYEKVINNKQFLVIIDISSNKQSSQVIDLNTQEEYILVDVKDTLGKYSSKIKEEYEYLLDDIINNCTNINIFKSKQSREIIAYLKDKYATELEYLWEKHSNNAAFRNKVNNRWFGVMLTVSAKKLGIDSDEFIEIIDLKYQKEKIEEIVDNKVVFSGYHMNKKSWITIKLDDSVKTEEIFRLIDNSYNLSNI